MAEITCSRNKKLLHDQHTSHCVHRGNYSGRPQLSHLLLTLLFQQHCSLIYKTGGDGSKKHCQRKGGKE